ncbi:endonuclease/exonuclease/phosphatase family protein [Rubrivirga marina]|uniref:endonuclease/exonuclease/phosphatase family protein n=1 Tax=Rubrivirga marina TaxID=1196024 RepID=UPI0015C81A72|nr:endonuclease/exonuclease/phosphatase family protein [Rubrivirga marina]
MTRLLLLAALGLASCAAPPASAPLATVDVVTLNLWHDQDDWPARLGVIADTLGALRPDVIVLQEVLQDSAKGLANQAETLGARLGYAVVFASVNGPDEPKRYGNAILSRHPVRDTSWVRLRPLTDYRVAARARLDVDGRPLDVLVTHLHHTVEGDSIRAVQVADLLAFLDRTAEAPWVAAGDFNAPSDAPSLAPLADRAASAFDAIHPGAEVSTLVEALGHTPRWIDHVFAGPGLRPVDARIVLGDPVGGVQPSDHRGVWARLRWAPAE